MNGNGTTWKEKGMERRTRELESMMYDMSKEKEREKIIDGRVEEKEGEHMKTVKRKEIKYGDTKESE